MEDTEARRKRILEYLDRPPQALQDLLGMGYRNAGDVLAPGRLNLVDEILLPEVYA